ncbi:SIMPL domain-containing protein [Lysinibacillus fusiformis]|uniref:SIMPL domain-containing protein n=1 Tax=Lysinibacillus fusiformis TaxID=28031 RepID=UPI000501501C|nr:SIMPL domain-containing protein [Lysinibacillus fusiformis]KGA81920.1 periplasmic immunogenic protein [Lysinibacillus fusiformis]MCT6815257.1 SIMPL domain-containing protein [Lysinibacillus fusiformis]MCT6929345.1 SIMPL domain-containing protein [Lysinibacillus fusiformis]MCT6933740.1 SIMPL domain-containing protein [Lysinibacillus fusiformis]
MYYAQLPHQASIPPRVITVTGTGQVKAKPSAMQLQIEVQTQGQNVQEPQQKNAATMKQVIQSITALGIPSEQIQTAAYTITPLYHFEDGQQIFTGYEVTNAITVNVSDPERVGFIIDTAVENGANRISNIQFKVDRADAYYQQALSLALHNAQAKAKTIAETMHLPLQLLPTEIVEEQVNTPILYRSMAVSSDMTPIEQGQIDINASVRVNFQY